MDKQTLNELKELFRQWLGALSIEEIMSNFAVIELSKIFEEGLRERTA